MNDQHLENLNAARLRRANRRIVQLRLRIESEANSAEAQGRNPNFGGMLEQLHALEQRRNELSPASV